MDFLRDDEILYNKQLMKCLRTGQRERLCGISFVLRKHGQRCLPQIVLEPAHTRQERTRDHFPFLRDHIMRHGAKSEFRVPKGSAFQATAAVSSASRLETVHVEPCPG